MIIWRLLKISSGENYGLSHSLLFWCLALLLITIIVESYVIVFANCGHTINSKLTFWVWFDLFTIELWAQFNLYRHNQCTSSSESVSESDFDFYNGSTRPESSMGTCFFLVLCFCVICWSIWIWYLTFMLLVLP